VRVQPIATVGLLTVIACLLRLSQIHQSLLGDEVFTLHDIQRRSLGAVLTTVNTGGENSPPLFFVLAWASAKLGDPTVWIRLPSLVLGAAAVPLVYGLGRATFGRTGGLLGAAIIALSPFTVYYGSEARPYATLTFLVALSTISLLKATRTRSVRWWCLYVISAAAAAYTHYTCIFLLAVQGAWSLWVCRDRLRQPLVANAIVVLLYLPWIPNLRGKDLGVIGFLYPLQASNVVKDSIRSIAGYPWSGLGVIPSVFGLAAIGACALVGLAAVLRRWRRSSHGAWRFDPDSPRILVAALAVATPLGLLLYSVLVTDIWLPRGLSASLPAAALVLGGLLSNLPRRWVALTATVVLVTLSAGTIRSFGADYRREPYRQMAAYLDRVTRPTDPVIMATIIGAPAIFVQMHKPHLIVTRLSPSVWRMVRSGGSAYLVLDDHVAQVLRFKTPHPAGLQLVARMHYRGSLPTELLVYHR
jgi:mannosyltransferase